MPHRSQLTPRECEQIRALAATIESQAWDADVDASPPPVKAHVTHALALRLACGESPEEAHSHLLAAKRNT